MKKLKIKKIGYKKFLKNRYTQDAESIKTRLSSSEFSKILEIYNNSLNILNTLDNGCNTNGDLIAWDSENFPFLDGQLSPTWFDLTKKQFISYINFMFSLINNYKVQEYINNQAAIAYSSIGNIFGSVILEIITFRKLSSKKRAQYLMEIIVRILNMPNVSADKRISLFDSAIREISTFMTPDLKLVGKFFYYEIRDFYINFNKYMDMSIIDEYSVNKLRLFILNNFSFKNCDLDPKDAKNLKILYMKEQMAYTFDKNNSLIDSSIFSLIKIREDEDDAK